MRVLCTLINYSIVYYFIFLTYTLIIASDDLDGGLIFYILFAYYSSEDGACIMVYTSLACLRTGAYQLQTNSRHDVVSRHTALHSPPSINNIIGILLILMIL